MASRPSASMAAWQRSPAGVFSAPRYRTRIGPAASTAAGISAAANRERSAFIREGSVARNDPHRENLASYPFGQLLLKIGLRLSRPGVANTSKNLYPRAMSSAREAIQRQRERFLR